MFSYRYLFRLITKQILYNHLHTQIGIGNGTEFPKMNSGQIKIQKPQAFQMAKNVHGKFFLRIEKQFVKV